MVTSAALLVGYVGLHVLLCVHGLHRAWLQLQLLRSPPEPVPAPVDVWPAVTVQLPVFNERDVVERIIAATAQLDYPRDALEIQVLDDSTDDTTALAEDACARLRALGIDAKTLHRGDRTGFKAGALDAGLRVAKADRIAIFDADFTPPTDFLRRTVPYLEAGVGMVQARWGHLNVRNGVLPFLQAMLLDGHFVVEQPARYRARRWMQFNGTAGIWRRDTIERAGGWEHDTLTEDLDLSYRAQLAGERFVYLDDLVAPAEVPATMAAFKAQQHRWGKGMVQALKKTLGRIWRSQASLAHKVEATLHLSSVLAYPLVAVLSVLLPLGLFARARGWMVVPWWVDIVLFLVATAAIASFYVVAAVGAKRPGALWRVLAVPAAMALGVGLAVAQTRAVAEGLFGRTGEFVRTPKAGSGGRSSYRARIDGIAVVETAMAVWLFVGAGWAVWEGWFGALPFLLLFGGGYGFVGVQALLEGLDRRPRTQRPTSINTATAAGTQVSAHSHSGSDHTPVAASYPESTP